LRIRKNLNNDGKIFILDDSVLYTKVLAKTLEKKLKLSTIVVHSYLEAKEIYERNHSEVFLNILDLNLPDSKDYEHIDFFLKYNIPSIVLTGDFSETVREMIFDSKNIIDYALKTRKEDMEYLLNLINRLRKNLGSKVILASSNLNESEILSDFLESQLFEVIHANNGLECIEYMTKNPSVQLVIIDSELNELDGYQTTTILREKYAKDKLCILGISYYEGKNVTSRFIKIGVNDVIHRPFFREEFFCKINLHMEVMENFEKIKYLANYDYLTGAMNRRYFFEIVDLTISHSNEVSIAQLDIDHFKKINDTHGHDAGDEAIKLLANLIKEYIRNKAITARFGGEEFVIVTTGVPRFDLENFYDGLRKKIESTYIEVNEKKIQFTISIGIFYREKNENIDVCLSIADKMLYRAKNEGRNKIYIYKD
jgi:diguanylate cyclase (GGDEF)-like protein